MPRPPPRPKQQRRSKTDKESPPDGPTNGKGKSPAHELIATGKVALVSFDVETGGEKCGVCQISAVAFDLEGNSLCNDYDAFVKPPASAVWCQQAMSVHGLYAGHDNIKNAAPIAVVWPTFVKWCDDLSNNGETKVILVAWNGTSCDMKWIYRLTSPSGIYKFKLPDCFAYFCDPYMAINHYKSCALHPNKTGLNLSLPTVYKFVTGNEMVNAHNSLFDARAQKVVMLDRRFLYAFFDTKVAIVPMEAAMKAKERNEIKQIDELSRPVPEGWVEEDRDKETEWEPPARHAYLGASGGPKHGPTAAIKNVAMKPGAQLVDLLLFIIPVWLLQKIADQTNKYATKDWVRPMEVKDAEGNVRKKRWLIPCLPSHPDARHRASADYVTVTAGYLLAWIGILIIIGAYGLRKARLVWMGSPHGPLIPWIQNAMPRDRFEQIRRFLHFTDSDRTRKKGEAGYDPLQKIKFFMDTVMAGIQKSWTLGQKICIDESMIKYVGRAIEFVQFMPAKPIKHGIKVFALCCAYTGVCYGWEVYTGSKGEPTGQAVKNLVLRLVGEVCCLSGQAGRILFTDNWYTSMTTAKAVWENFNMLYVGTMALTNKGCRTREDFPFDQLSKGAQGRVKRGWFRRAIQTVKTRAGMFTLQATIWMDRKLVGFLHSAQVTRSDGFTVKRYNRKEKKRVDVPTPPVTGEYADCMGAVDMTDGDGANYSLSFRSNRWYLRLCAWTLERAVHCVYQVAIFLTNEAIERLAHWKKYTSKEDGRFKFAVELGIECIDKGIRMDWVGDINDDSGKPAWCRQTALVPCDCKLYKCFFCATGRTTGIVHKPKRQIRPSTVPRGHARNREPTFKNGKRCCMCYQRLSAANPNWSSAEKKSQRKKTTKGCRGCVPKAPVCELCWPSFVHRVGCSD